ncbi:hypothetical protein HF847_01060 [Clostridium cochlearium]|uniref:hypothetical protein n=1 Tax=Clostridium cochlearium TaxID=1494 RepID=UPI0014595A4A|nr:hypothetical protein [Clostridium cochlearium]NME94598.1 hypothetical protein [Clostridium cochlearium]
MYYVIRNKRLKNFLYALGLEYKAQPDRTGRTDYVYLFTKSKELFEAITFYTNFRNKQKH